MQATNEHASPLLYLLPRLCPVSVVFCCALLQAYLRQNATAVADWGHLEPVLGVFRKLLSSKANEAFAFNLLGTTVMNVSCSNFVGLSASLRLPLSVYSGFYK